LAHNDDAEFIDTYRDRVIIVDPDPVGTTDFDISPTEADFLVLQGRADAIEHLHRYLPEQQRPTEDEVLNLRKDGEAAKAKAANSDYSYHRDYPRL
jgi:hypothetical protein